MPADRERDHFERQRIVAEKAHAVLAVADREQALCRSASLQRAHAGKRDREDRRA
jgi:hypothetical protein